MLGSGGQSAGVKWCESALVSKCECVCVRSARELLHSGAVCGSVRRVSLPLESIIVMFLTLEGDFCCCVNLRASAGFENRDVARLHSVSARASIGQARRAGLLVRIGFPFSPLMYYFAIDDSAPRCVSFIFDFSSCFVLLLSWSPCRRAMKTVSDSAEFAAKYEAMK